MPSQPLPGAGAESASMFVPKEMLWYSGWRLYALAAVGILALALAVTFWQQSRGVGRQALATVLLADANSCEEWMFSDGTKQSRSCTSGVTAYAYGAYGNNSCPNGYQLSNENGTCDGDAVYRCVTSLSCAPPPPTVTLAAAANSVYMYQPLPQSFQNPETIAYHSSVERTTLTWSAVGSITSCTTSGNWSSSGNNSGSGLTDPQTDEQTYTYQCAGPGGSSNVASQTVNVLAPDLTVGSICVGSSLNYSHGWPPSIDDCSSEIMPTSYAVIGANFSNSGTLATLVQGSDWFTSWGSHYIINAIQQADDSSGTNARSIDHIDNIYNSIPGGTTFLNTGPSFSFGTPGSYYFRACADAYNNFSGYSEFGQGSLPELNEDNNCGPWTQISVCQSTKGEACTSGANVCGMTNPGTVACDGSCGAQTPSDALCPEPPSCSTLQASPTETDSGNSITLSWSCQNAASCAAISNTDGFSTGSVTSGTDNSVTPLVGLGATSAVTYGITCTGSTGLSTTAYFPSVTVHGPSATISATPGRVSTPPNNTSTITWSTTGGAFGCTAKKNGQPYGAITGDSGSLTEPVESKTTYTITCDSSLGQLIRSVTVFLPIGYTAF